MLTHRADRRELAVLGLVALGWALLVAPLLHRQEHAHGHQHHHGPSSPLKQTEDHGAGTFEHQSVAFVSAAPLSFEGVVLLAQVEPSARPLAPSVELRRRVEQSQAP
jgi:hypothetical protein